MAKTETKKPGFFKRIGSFFSGAYAELKKVIWPNRSELFTQTLIVIAMCTAFAVIISLLDFAFVNFFDLLYGLAG